MRNGVERERGSRGGSTGLDVGGSSDSRFPIPDSRQLEHLRRVWQTLGRDDPMWAVLSHADKRGGRWDPEEFLATGEVEVDVQLAALADANLPAARWLALDFGCGAGRLSRALARHFAHVVGIDVSASMIDAARRLNADVPNVEFRENASARIERIADASVDFVFSHITLQHIPGDLAAGYVAEFFRVLAPGGVAAFQDRGEVENGKLRHVPAMVSTGRGCRRKALAGSHPKRAPGARPADAACAADPATPIPPARHCGSRRGRAHAPRPPVPSMPLGCRRPESIRLLPPALQCR